MRIALLISLCLLLSLGLGCSSSNQTATDPNASVPSGDPPFPPLGDWWIVDKAGVLSNEAVETNNKIIWKLDEDKIAEVVVVIINGVKKPSDWATHYGRFLKLGEQGPSTEGGNNGIVWLIRPDADDKITISVGRGLPKFTSIDYGKIMTDARDYLAFGNFNQAVSVVVTGTDKKLRELYPVAKTTSPGGKK